MTHTVFKISMSFLFKKEPSVEPKSFDPNNPKLVKGFFLAIKKACQELSFDLRRLDWFNLSPAHADFYRKNVNLPDR